MSGAALHGGATTADLAVGYEQRYSLTFGRYNQTAPWTDVRSLTWRQLADLLTRHAIGNKEGSCVVPALFSGQRRQKAHAARIEVAFLDCDSGAQLPEISKTIKGFGWAAVIGSTHSHLITQTVAKRSHWDRFRTRSAEQAEPAQAFLLEEKHYLPIVASGAQVVAENAEFVTFVHNACAKFRIAIPLLQPWLATDYPTQGKANATWEDRVAALAAALGLQHDQACADTSRLFYLPRRPKDGPPPETQILEGVPCDIFALPAATGKSRSSATRRTQRRRDRIEPFADPSTGELLDLATWAAEFGSRFEIVAALRARRPGVFLGVVTDGVKHAIKCVNEEEHSRPGADVATIVLNASESHNRGFVYHCRHAHCDGRDRLFFLRSLLASGWLQIEDLSDPAFLSDQRPPPVIRVIGGQLPDLVDKAEAALLTANLGLYQRGSFIVRPGRVMIRVAQDREIPAQRILAVGEHALVEEMTRAAEWQKYDARSRKWVASDTPTKVAATYLERAGRWRLPVLTGIIDAPTLRPDGSLLDTPGYDTATGLLFDPGSCPFPSIPDKPTRVHALAALARLIDLIEGFPFKSKADQSVALSGILTACVRRALRSAPLHSFTSPVAGSGKSMLVDIASVIASGSEAGVIAQGANDAEFEKRLGALLLAGDLIIAIDNCEAPLRSEFLCSMLTQQIVRPRILGRSEAPELPSNAFVTATGNNLVLVGDLTRRALRARLDPEDERPELRIFRNNPVRTAQAHRGQFVAAALTILRAYHIAGHPQRSNPLGSFEQWSNWVRGAIVWLGQEDPVKTMDAVRDTDPQRDCLAAVLAQWRDVIGGTEVPVRHIIDRAVELQAATGGGAAKAEYHYADFREALLSVAGADGAINGKRLGKWLAGSEGRIVQGMRIVRAGLSAGIQRWRVEIV